MTTLRIAVEKYLPYRGVRAGAVADILPIPADKSRGRRGVIIPVGSDTERAEVNVEPGRYLVRTFLPSGELLDQVIDVPEGPPIEVLLTEPKVAPGGVSTWRFLFDSLEQRSLRTSRSNKLVAFEFWSLRDASRHGRGWAQFEELARVFNTGDYSILGEPFSRKQADQSVNIQYENTTDNRVSLLVKGIRYEGITWLSILRDDFAEFVALPLPWNLRDGDSADIAIEVPGNDEPLSIALRDPDLGPLLGYTMNGSLSTAGMMLQPGTPAWASCEWALFAKGKNPYAAALGGYVMLKSVGTRDGEVDAPWHQWIRNLANRFEFLPDGAVLKGWLRLVRAQGEEEKMLAHASMMEAIQRGIPVFTTIFCMLLDGLTLLEKLNELHDLAPPDVLATVRNLAAFLDVSQPFTTFRFNQS